MLILWQNKIKVHIYQWFCPSNSVLYSVVIFPTCAYFGGSYICIPTSCCEHLNFRLFLFPVCTRGTLYRDNNFLRRKKDHLQRERNAAPWLLNKFMHTYFKRSPVLFEKIEIQFTCQVVIQILPIIFFINCHLITLI